MAHGDNALPNASREDGGEGVRLTSVSQCPSPSWQRAEFLGKLEQCVFDRPAMSAIIPTSQWGREWGRWPEASTSLLTQR